MGVHVLIIFKLITQPYSQKIYKQYFNITNNLQQIYNVSHEQFVLQNNTLSNWCALKHFI